MTIDQTGRYDAVCALNHGRPDESEFATTVASRADDFSVVTDQKMTVFEMPLGHDDGRSNQGKTIPRGHLAGRIGGYG